MNRSEVFDGILARLQGMAWRLGVLLVVVCLLVPPASLIYAALTDQPWWRLFRAEGNLTDWWSSMQLVILGLLAWANGWLRTLMERVGLLAPWSLGAVWRVTALGFLLLALDERFNYHEWLRDELFRAHDWFTHSKYIIAGDVGLYLFFLVGLTVVPLLLAELRARLTAARLLIAGLVLSVPLLVIDSLQDRVMRHWWNWRFWDYFFEEQGEIVAQLLFALALLMLIHHRLGQWRAALASERES